MNNTIYKRTGEFPRCKHCKTLMEYWDLREDQSSYECDSCQHKKMVENVSEIIKNIFTRKS